MADFDLPKEYESLCQEVTVLHTKLRSLQMKFPEGSNTRKTTGELALKIENWCDVIEDSMKNKPIPPPNCAFWEEYFKQIIAKGPVDPFIYSLRACYYEHRWREISENTILNSENYKETHKQWKLWYNEAKMRLAKEEIKGEKNG